MGASALSLRVVGDEALVSIRGEDLSEADGRELVARYFGHGRSLPVREMRYWLIGVPAPGSPHQEVVGEGARLASLAQSGWQVRYDRYQPVGSLVLPARMELTTEGLRLRVVVSDWRLPP
jgi:outer membrane lipoprotein LolB